MQRITVAAGDDSIDVQARAYAEYRVFATLTRHTRNIRRARVVLRPARTRGHGDRIACIVTVALEPAGSLTIRGTAPHVYAAINRAVERLGGALGRRIEPRLSS